jgi:hypothetical protein
MIDHQLRPRQFVLPSKLCEMASTSKNVPAADVEDVDMSSDIEEVAPTERQLELQRELEAERARQEAELKRRREAKIQAAREKKRKAEEEEKRKAEEEAARKAAEAAEAARKAAEEKARKDAEKAKKEADKVQRLQREAAEARARQEKETRRTAETEEAQEAMGDASVEPPATAAKATAAKAVAAKVRVCERCTAEGFECEWDKVSTAVCEGLRFSDLVDFLGHDLLQALSDEEAALRCSGGTEGSSAEAKAIRDRYLAEAGQGQAEGA